MKRKVVDKLSVTWTYEVMFVSSFVINNLERGEQHEEDIKAIRVTWQPTEETNEVKWNKKMKAKGL